MRNAYVHATVTDAHCTVLLPKYAFSIHDKCVRYCSSSTNATKPCITFVSTIVSITCFTTNYKSLYSAQLYMYVHVLNHVAVHVLHVWFAYCLCVCFFFLFCFLDAFLCPTAPSLVTSVWLSQWAMSISVSQFVPLRPTCP
jgi:hypothetical protein